MCAEVTGARPEPIGNVALGPASTDAEIEEALRSCRFAYERPADRVAAAADIVTEGGILGWFQGRAEFGPRGLGQRAILCDPSDLATKGRLLRDVKPRAEHHPFALSVTETEARRLFGDGRTSPYMMQFARVPETATAALGGVLGADRAVRWHGVTPEREPEFHRLLVAVGERRGGLPAVLNTSLNVPGKPPAVTPRDALEVFATTGLDALVVGPFLVRKPSCGAGA